MARSSRFSLLLFFLLLGILASLSQAQGPGAGPGPAQSQGPAPAQGQGQGNSDGLPNLNSITGDQASKGAGGKPTPAASGSNGKGDGNSAKTTSANKASNTPQASNKPQNLPQISGTSGDGKPLPSLTGGVIHPSGLPTLSQFLIPSAIVPDTSNAPFMQKSSLPEGTVFIAVGATLGFLGFCILLWRGMIAYSMQQSAKRAAYAHSDEKAGFRPQPPSGYNSAFQSGYHSANLSMESLTGKTGYEGANHRKNKESKSRKASSRVPTNSSLFFSPTAGVGSGVHTARTSTYLPAGYYASGASAPAAGSAITTLGGPPNTGYTRMDDYFSGSPPISPGIPPPETRRNDSRDGLRDSSYSHGQNQSRRATGGLAASSSMETFGGRAPSQHLDDMLENHGSAMS